MIEEKKDKQTIIISLDVETTGHEDVTRYGIVSLGYCIGNVEGNILTKGRINFNTEPEVMYFHPIMYYLDILMMYEYFWIGFLGALLGLLFYTPWFCSIIFISLLVNFKLLHLLGVHVDFKHWEPRCVEEFWCQHQDKLAEFKRSALPRYEATRQFIEILDKFYNPKFYNIIILTDSPAFDLSFINAYLCTYGNRMPISYNVVGKYNGTVNTFECIHDLLVMNKSVTKNKSWLWNQDEYNKACNTYKHLYTHFPDQDAEYNYRIVIHMYRFCK